MGVFSIFRERASTAAGEVDALYVFLLVIGVGMTAIIFFFVFFFVFFFAVKYRRKRPDDPAPKAIHGSLPLEIA
jgi:heme/copper-type cytochrome/quinol oxidase subunit 2